MCAKKVTIREVAKRAGVSIATVSQILNGKAMKFDPLTVQKVQAARDELGYEADHLARQMVGKQSKTIGILVPEITNSFFSTLVKGIEEELLHSGYISMLCNGGFNGAKEEKALLELAQRGVDGFIIASPSISDEVLKEILQIKKRPVIVLDQKTTVERSDEVATDDFNGGLLAAQYLKKMGHTKAAVVVPDLATVNIMHRLQGFLVEFPQALQLKTELSKNGGQAVVAELLDQKIEAVFALSDELAFGIYLGMRQNDKSVPDDLSVIGYDDVEMCRYVTPALTTVAQPIYELGKQAADLMVKRLADPTSPYVKRILPVELAIRGSVKVKI